MEGYSSKFTGNNICFDIYIIERTFRKLEFIENVLKFVFKMYPNILC
jgi:hypothetical protein